MLENRHKQVPLCVQNQNRQAILQLLRNKHKYTQGCPQGQKKKAKKKKQIAGVRYTRTSTERQPASKCSRLAINSRR